MSISISHCVKSVRFRSFPGPYSVRMRKNTDQKNSEYGLFSRSVVLFAWGEYNIPPPIGKRYAKFKRFFHVVTNAEILSLLLLFWLLFLVKNIINCR